VRNATAWASAAAGEDLAAQIDPDFTLGPHATGLRRPELAQPLRVGPRVFQAESGPGRQRPGEHEISGVLERAVQQAGRAGCLQTDRPPRVAKAACPRG
jgi:hypothetical protein